MKTVRKYYQVVLSGYVVLQQESKILLSRRFNTGYQDGNYSLPAGHIEEGEFAIDGTIREAAEEVGININKQDLKFAHFMHRHCGDHERIDLFYTCSKWSGEISNMEPDRCDDLSWFSINALPKNIIPYIRAALLSIHKQQFYSDFSETSNKVLI